MKILRHFYGTKLKNLKLKNLKLQNLKVSYKLNILFFLILIFSFVIISYAAFKAISKTLFDQALQTTEQIISQTGEKVNLTFSEINKLTVLAKNNRQLVEIIDSYETLNLDEKSIADDQISNILTSYFSNRDELADVYFVTNGRDYTLDRSYVGLSDGYSFTKDNIKFKWFTKTNEKSLWTETYVSDYKNTYDISPYVITLFKKVNNYTVNQKDMGTLIVNIKESLIKELLKNVKFSYDKSHVFIIDKNGYLIEDPKNKEFLGKKLQYKYIKDILKTVKKDDFKMTSKKNYNVNDINSLLTYAKIDSTDWIIVGVVPMNSITKIVYDTYFVVWIICSLVIVLGLFLSRIIT
ncbi:MAG: cache domain-containing protein, partial [Clostridiales bacterium]